MKKLLLLSIITLLLSSCRGALISDDIIIVHSKHKLENKHYKYFYKCYQNGFKMRIYSNSDYEPGQPLIIK